MDRGQRREIRSAKFAERIYRILVRTGVKISSRLTKDQEKVNGDVG